MPASTGERHARQHGVRGPLAASSLRINNTSSTRQRPKTSPLGPLVCRESGDRPGGRFFTRPIVRCGRKGRASVSPQGWVASHTRSWSRVSAARSPVTPTHNTRGLRSPGKLPLPLAAREKAAIPAAARRTAASSAGTAWSEISPTKRNVRWIWSAGVQRMEFPRQ